MARARDVFESPDIVLHTEAILELKLKLGKLDAQEVSLCIAIGDHLIAVKAATPRGDWTRYLASKVDIHQTLASGMMKLAEMSRVMSKKWIDAVAPLGPTKTIRACYASDGFRPRLSARWSWKGKKAINMLADEFDAAVDAADPGHRARRSSDAAPAKGTKPAASIPLDAPTLADITLQLKELRRTERDPKKWKPLLDWLLGEFDLAGDEAPATPKPAANPPAVTGGMLPGLTMPGYGAGAPGVPAANLNPDGKARLESILAIVRQLTKEMQQLVDAKSKVGADLKADAIDKTSDLVDVARHLAAWVSGTPRR